MIRIGQVYTPLTSNRRRSPLGRGGLARVGLGAVEYRLDSASGVIIAENTETLGAFKRVQRANNMYWGAKGVGSRLFVDGQLGPKTLTSVGAQIAHIGRTGIPLLGPGDLQRLADYSRTYAEVLWTGAGSKVPPSASADVLPTDYRPALVSPDKPGTEQQQQDEGGSKKAYYVIGGLILLGVGIWALSRKS